MKIKAFIFLTGLLILTEIPGYAGNLKYFNVNLAGMEVAVNPDTPPGWVLGKDHPVFPQEGYLVGVGFSNADAVSANEAARSSLAKIFRVRIRSDMRGVSATEETYIKSVIETEVGTVLEGVEIKDGWYDKVKGAYYSLAILDRKLAETTIANRVRNVESSVKRSLSDGSLAEKQADVVGALSHYLSGYKNAPVLSQLKSALYVVTRSNQPSDKQSLTAGEFESRIRNIVHNLRLAIVSGNEQKIKSRKSVINPLVARVYLQTDTRQMPVSNIPFVFKFEMGHGELEQEKTSGSDGTVQTLIHKIYSYDETRHAVTMKLDFDRFISSFNNVLANKFLSPLRRLKTTFNYSIQVRKEDTGKTFAWRKGITDLANQVISNIPPGETPQLGVMVFKDLRFDKITPFSKILKEDIKTIMAQAEDLKIKEIYSAEGDEDDDLAATNSLDFYVSGSYRMERRGLEVRARLIETKTSLVQSSANTLIARKKINPDDLALLEPEGAPTGSMTSNDNDTYQEKLEKIVAMEPDDPPFNVKVWTAKKEYQIGEKIVFNVSSEKSGYLTLFDVGPNGNITVIFPNFKHKDNYIRAGTNYQVPSPDDEFEFDLQGPPGLERVKAIVTLNDVSLINLNLDNGFHSVQRGTTRGLRDIKVISKKILSSDGGDWAQAYSGIFIFKKNQSYTRGLRKIPVFKKP